MTTSVFLTPARLSRMYLQRHNSGRCSQHTNRISFHEAKVAIGDGPGDMVTGDVHNHTDSRWPKQCGCGYTFTDRDARHLFSEKLYTRSDTGDLITLADAPVGAMVTSLPTK